MGNGEDIMNQSLTRGSENVLKKNLLKILKLKGKIQVLGKIETRVA